MMDKVFIESLVVETLIGVHTWEREHKRHVVFDIEMDVDCSKAGQSDQLADALDYAAVAQMVTEVAAVSTFQLIEALAQTIADKIMAGFSSVSRVRMTLRKPGAIGRAANVGVVIECVREV